MMWSSTIIFNLLFCIAIAEVYDENNATIYDTYEGVPVTEEKFEKYKQENRTDICTIAIKPCDENEYRRSDGSCNNLKYPSRGTYHTPFWRVLPANYTNHDEPRLTKSGEPLPPARNTRRNLLRTGASISRHLATSASYFPEFVGGDIVSIHDIQNWVFNTTNCCEPSGKNSYWCTPMDLPQDDYAHRFDNLRCMNQTRPMSFHNMGCASRSATPNRISYSTPDFDLSNVYNFAKDVINRLRTFEGGKLKVEVVDGKEFPSDKEATTTCFIKEARDTGCVRIVPTGVMGTLLFTLYFWRYHNMVADNLAAVNPCWDDDKLFSTAQDITIAWHNQILYYEYFGLILGTDNLINDGVLLNGTGFRDLYDENVIPQVALEFPYILRWFHKTQNGIQKFYDKDGYFLKEASIVNFTLRPHDLAFDDTLGGITRGIHIQPSGRFHGDSVHPEMSEVGLGQYQRATDIPSGDLNNGKYLGLPPYIHYRDYCTKYTKQHKTFEDISDVIYPHKMEELKENYKHPIDIELMAGAWSEQLMEDAWVPPTVYCLIVAQLQRSLTYDRHWYERPNRPHAFTYDQLQQVRKASLGGLLCAMGNEVTTIQPRAFERISATNPLVDCSEIPQIDFSLWSDDTCNKCK